MVYMAVCAYTTQPEPNNPRELGTSPRICQHLCYI